MKVLVIGGGGREHALAWRLRQSEGVSQVFVAPGNAGTARDPQLSNLDVTDKTALRAWAQTNGIALTVVGPEAPLAAGVVDEFRAHGLAIFGPTKAAAQLESSKAFSKAFMERHGIPTASYQTFTDAAKAHAYVDAQGAPIVVKADGLAAGKGVVVCEDADEARRAARELFSSLGAAATELVVEERLYGREVSVMAITDGRELRILATAEDHKAIGDGDRGPNTGGMGAVSPAPWVTDALIEHVRERVFLPTLRGLEVDGLEFRGVLYAGLMITHDGPKMLEYNVRFGDPETQAVLPRLRGDLGDLLYRAATGQLGPGSLEFSSDVSVAVVMASPGYPGTPAIGSTITGVDEVEGEVRVFHAGTARSPRGELVTAGGRVLAVVALGTDVTSARAHAYEAVDRIHFEGAQVRRDIGARPASAPA